MPRLFSSSQLRAARGLLNWSRPDLAARTGVSEQTIHRFENDMGEPEVNTQKKIARVLDENGVEFSDNQGVRYKANDIEVFEGRDRFDEFYDFMYEHVKSKGGAVCVSGVDESLFAIHRSFASSHRERMIELVKKRNDISVKILVKEGDYNFTAAEYAKYKWQSKEDFSPASFYAFGNCLALISFAHHTPPYVVLHKSGPFAEAYRHAFNIAWKNAKEPPVLKNTGK